MIVESVDVMQAVERKLNQVFPGEPVYWDRLPKDLSRPCFTIECQKAEEADANAVLVQKQLELLVTCWAEADAYGDSSRAELTRRQSRALGLFAAGSFPVLDRHLSVRGSKGEQTPELAMVTGLFSWLDGRPEYTDPEVPDTGIPRMEYIEINNMERTDENGREHRASEAEDRL